MSFENLISLLFLIFRNKIDFYMVSSNFTQIIFGF